MLDNFGVPVEISWIAFSSHLEIEVDSWRLQANLGQPMVSLIFSLLCGMVQTIAGSIKVSVAVPFGSKEECTEVLAKAQERPLRGGVLHGQLVSQKRY